MSKANQIFHGDCLELMKEIPDKSVDLIVTDPPYGISYASARIKDKNRRLGGILNDNKPLVEFIPNALRLMKDCGAMFIFVRWDTQQKFIDEVERCGGRVKSVLIWDKGTHGMGDLKASYGSRYESILFVPGRAFKFPGKRPQDIIPVAKVPPVKLRHPNEKPVELIEKLILDTTDPGAVVLDTFMGSGSTGVACVNTGRRFIGIELDPHYYAIARERIEQAETTRRQAAGGE